MQPLNIDVHWQGGRVVSVRLERLSILGSRARTGQGASEPQEDTAEGPALNSGDVTSLKSLHDYLRTVTREARNGSTIVVAGFTNTVFKVLELLEIEGPPPDPIVVKLEAS